MMNLRKPVKQKTVNRNIETIKLIKFGKNGCKGSKKLIYLSGKGGVYMSEENQEKGEIVELEEEIKTDNEGIKISNDVVAVIAGVAASEVPGVSGMAGGFAGGITEVFSGKKNLAKGIKVEVDQTQAKIDVNIIVEYGSRIPDVAFEIQNRVKKAVESMTGLKVEEVNVHVQGVNIDVAKAQSKQEEVSDIENEQ